MEMNNNPSPGNKLGGLTTILEKSLGAAAKGGTTPLNAVYRYADPVTEKGFVFMDTPGYDPVSATGQVAGGANILCFTTGRGSAYGCKPTPSIKIATNSDIYAKMIDDMDINGGDVLDGVSLAEEGPGDLREDPQGRVGREEQVRGARLRRQRVRALADRRHDVRQVRAVITGRVQGVGFRDWTLREATARGSERLGPQPARRDGRGGSSPVTMPAVEAMLAVLREGPPAARVRTVDVSTDSAEARSVDRFEVHDTA